jgi:23S rRNA pseudouridine1911/1915/1917 synthase
MAGQRLDQALSALFPSYSRSRLQQWLRDGQARVDGRLGKPKARVAGGETVSIDAQLEEAGDVVAQPIPLDIVYEDASLLVINKPAGLVIHPAAGNPDGTLQNALLHFDGRLGVLPRYGIVHRLDKDTTGLLVVARTLAAHHSLVQQLQARSVHREYLAIVDGVLTAGGTIDAPIGRHPRDRLRMAVVPGGKPAITHYRVLERYRAHTLVSVRLETGRTHQIRVHMASRRMPLVGDPLYGGRFRPAVGMSEALREFLRTFPRQALHAQRLALSHPESGEPLSWEAPVPDDMSDLITRLREDTGAMQAGKSDD